MAIDETIFEWFPALAHLKTCPQDAYYHAEGDVWTHTLMVLDELVSAHAYQNANEEEQFILFYSALLHDISKPACTSEENGRIISPGHSKRGAIDARIALWKHHVPFHARESICQIIAHHQVPFFAFDHKEKTPVFIAHELSWKLPLHLLIQVARADMKGRTSEAKAKALDDIDLFEVLAEEEECLLQPKAFPDEETRLTYFRGLGKISPEYAFYKEKGTHVIVLSGLPASGKDFYLKKQLSGLPVVSFDDAKEHFGITHRDNAGQSTHWAIEKAKEHLRNRTPFVFNATHISPLLRGKTIDLLFDYGAFVDLRYLEAPYEFISQRNAQRDSTLTQQKLEQMLFRWDVPTPLETHEITYEIYTPKPKNQRIIKT